MTITRLESPVNAPTTAIVVAAPMCPSGPISVGTSSSVATLPNVDTATGPNYFDFVVKEFNPLFQPGARMRAAVPGNAGAWMEGVVDSFDPSTNVLRLRIPIKANGGRVGPAGAGYTYPVNTWDPPWTLTIAGTPGDQGERGPQGQKGDPGAYGGPTGPQGPQGIQGIEGPTGPLGPQGNPATISVGTTNWLGAGSPAEVRNRGDQHNAILDFDIPSSGPIGPTGATGAQGSTGDTGIQGPTGSIGATGAKGDTGAQGNPGGPPVISSVPPNPVTETLWWDSSDGRLYISFDAQWVEVGGQ